MSFTQMINKLISSDRLKWIFVIGVVAISAGFTAKNVISYPTECMKEDVALEFYSPLAAKKIFTIF